MAGPALYVNWVVDTLTSRNALVVSQLEIGNYSQVLATGLLYQAVAAGTGSSCWASSPSDLATLQATVVTNTANIVTNTASIAALNVAAPSARAFGLPAVPILTGLLLTADTAYWVYQGYFANSKTFNRIRLHGVTAGVGAQTAEVALASSPAAPNRASQVLTKLAASASVAALTGTGLLANSSDLAAVVPAGTHLWAGIRTNMAATQPVLLASAADFGQGQVLATATAGALTGAGPWTGAVITHALTAQAPILVATLD